MQGLFYLILISFTFAKCIWRPTIRALNDSVVDLFFALPYSNEEESERLFRTISDPESSHYRQYMTADEVIELVAPDKQAQLHVQQYFKEKFPEVETRWSSWGHFVYFKLPVQEVEAMLGTQCHVHEYTCDDATVLQSTIKTSEHEFPQFELSDHIAYVGGVTQFPYARRTPKFRKRKIEEVEMEVNETNTTFADLIDSFSARPLSSSSTNPIQEYAGDKSVAFLITVLCPDGSPIFRSFTCADGSSLDEIVLRSSYGSDPQKSTKFDPDDRCGISPSTSQYQCIIQVRLKDNFVRVAFGFDLNFDGGGVYSYNLQYFVVGTNAMTPTWVNRYYSVPDGIQATNNMSYQAIGSLTLSQSTGYYSPKDLSTAYTLFGVPQTNVELVDFKGAINDPTSPDVETSLDIQWITSMGKNIRSTIWHSPANAGDSIEAIVSQIQDAAKAQQAPYVVSFSYGGPEVVLSRSVLSQQEAGFRALGLLGISVLVASGDTGPYWDTDCETFIPVYPASSEYVTSVGATQLVVQNLYNACKVEESVCSQQTGSSITSGGGFSSMIARPYWQNDAVEEYIRGEMPNTKNVKYNTANRAYPDISLFGRQFTIVADTTSMEVDGTSASAPALAGLISLINDMRFSKGLGPLGFLNPTLYNLQKKNPDAFHDILVGFNGCSKSGCCEEGFVARAGWDATTGLGSPVFDIFATELLGAPVNGSWNPIIFPDDLDCGLPVIQPNKEDNWGSIQTWLIVSGVIVALFGVGAIVGVWHYRQRRPVSHLQEELVH